MQNYQQHEIDIDAASDEMLKEKLFRFRRTLQREALAKDEWLLIKRVIRAIEAELAVRQRLTGSRSNARAMAAAITLH